MFLFLFVILCFRDSTTVFFLVFTSLEAADRAHRERDQAIARDARALRRAALREDEDLPPIEPLASTLIAFLYVGDVLN